MWYISNTKQKLKTMTKTKTKTKALDLSQMHPENGCTDHRPLIHTSHSDGTPHRYRCLNCTVTWTGKANGRPPKVSSICPHCGGACKKLGFQGNYQRFLCKTCGRVHKKPK